MVATMTGPNSAVACSITSRWPRCSGSKLPGQRAVAIRRRHGTRTRNETWVRPWTLCLLTRHPGGGSTGASPSSTATPGASSGEQFVPPAEPVGRIGDHEVDRAERAQRGHGIGGEHGRAIGEAELDQVGADHPHRIRRAFDEGAVRSAARQQLDPHRAAACVEVGHPGAVDRVEADERVGDRAAHHVGRRARALGRNGDRSTAQLTGDDPHSARLRACCNRSGRSSASTAAETPT